MDIKLQRAVVAAREGKKETAQVLLADLIQENPADADAWFLLSHLVDSEERQRAYLKRTLILDPNYEKAQQRLQQLDRSAATALSDVEEAAKPIVQTPEPQVVVEEQAAPEEQPAAPVPIEVVEETAEPETAEPLPVVFEAPQSIDADAADADVVAVEVVSETTAAPPAQPERESDLQPLGTPKRERPRQTGPKRETTAPVTAERETDVEPQEETEEEGTWLTRLLLALIIIAILVLAYLVYTILTGG